MRVQVFLIADGELVFMRFGGRQTVHEAMESVKDKTSMPGYRPELPELVDLSGITQADLDFLNMRRIAREACSKGVTATKKKRIAVFAPRDAIYGMARMFSTLVELDPANVEAAAFRTKEEALSWLERPETEFEDIPGFDQVLAT